MAYIYKGHYDIRERLADMTDKNGEPATFVFCVSEDRGPGKTFSICRMMLDKFLEDGTQFILFRRLQRELGSAAQGTFKGVFNELHPTWFMRETIKQKGTFSVITLYRGKDDENPQVCGYVVPISMCSSLKSVSSEFINADWALFDEFQPKKKSEYLTCGENGDEFSLFYDVYKSIARGNGSAVRPFRVFFSSNTIDISDPYLYNFGISRAIQEDTMLYRGECVVYERVEVAGLKKLHADSPIDRAAKTFLDRRGSNLWINTDSSLVVKNTKGWGHGTYIATIEYNGEQMGLLFYRNVNMWYISRTVEKNCKDIYNLTLATGATNDPILKTVNLFKRLKEALYMGRVRVHDVMLQTMLLDVLH